MSEREKEKMTSLIIIRGDQNTGKTTIAKGILDDLKQYATTVRYFDKDMHEMPIPALENGAPVSDFYAVLTIRRQTFAIISGGDTVKWVSQGLSWGWHMRVDGIIQCARDTKKTIMDHIDSVCKYLPRVDYGTKYYKSSTDREKQKKDIIDKVHSTILLP